MLEVCVPMSYMSVVCRYRWGHLLPSSRCTKATDLSSQVLRRYSRRSFSTYTASALSKSDSSRNPAVPDSKEPVKQSRHLLEAEILCLREWYARIPGGTRMDKQLYARMDKQLDYAIDQSFVAQSGDADLCFACKENEVCTFQVCKNASCKTADSNDDTGAIWVGERTTEFALCSECALTLCPFCGHLLQPSCGEEDPRAILYAHEAWTPDDSDDENTNRAWWQTAVYT